MELKNDSNIPIYIQIANMIEDQILERTLEEDEKVYSTNELSVLLHVNPATARKGLNLLVNEGILYKKRGVGMFVKKGAVEIIKSKRKTSFFNEYIPEIIREAKKLEIGKDELIDMIKSCEGGGVDDE
ncbi:GntR family transcriptional regulator [Halothermothrix orenii]|uniref:Regulatory protein GntR HTH n=1 Tax=Halothermothrix orenii (strain H 168 / OCM 544 / DSM 9562) TaxID=373903 RepID=B8D1Y2_HALOH|nr:GntR family transcriptional regulator [Halothermothrix orenii]ACL69209.1 regulatory protein GntR HTH [Halothermothrix orenii H 168]